MILLLIFETRRDAHRHAFASAQHLHLLAQIKYVRNASTWTYDINEQSNNAFGDLVRGSRE